MTTAAGARRRPKGLRWSTPAYRALRARRSSGFTAAALISASELEGSAAHQLLAQVSRDPVDDEDREEEQDDDGVRLGRMVATERQAEGLADPPAPDGADNRRGAHVDFGAEQRVGNEVWQHLRHHAEAYAFEPV